MSDKCVKCGLEGTLTVANGESWYLVHGAEGGLYRHFVDDPQCLGRQRDAEENASRTGPRTVFQWRVAVAEKVLGLPRGKDRYARDRHSPAEWIRGPNGTIDLWARGDLNQEKGFELIGDFCIEDFRPDEDVAHDMRVLPIVRGWDWWRAERRAWLDALVEPRLRKEPYCLAGEDMYEVGDWSRAALAVVEARPLVRTEAR